jgi:amino acid transporter
MPHGPAFLVALLLGLAAYLAAPALIALVRRHPERGLIYRLSPLSLLSVILWFALIAWALTGQRDDAVIARLVARLRRTNRLPLAIGLLIILGVAGSLLPMLR